ncbi:MAG: tetratricopeptide repeat protein [Alphaproteobacteria bacterium]|nr:tetratricopeptide repeat protein [Alphaproteobacteria bacterium]
MHPTRPLRRSLLLLLSLLTACGAAQSPPAAATGSDATVSTAQAAPPPAPRRRAPIPPGSAAMLTGRFASSQGDLDTAALAFQRALAADMDNEELRQKAFLTSLMAGRPEAERLAGLLGRNQAAQLLLAGRDAKAGAWAQAEARFASLPREGAAEIMRPMLIAWAQLGRGQPDAALATLQPLIDNRAFRAFYALHGALIADLSDRKGLAARLYRTAQTEFGGTAHLQLGRAIASWEARQGNAAEAEAALRAVAEGNDDIMMALPRLQADAATLPVRNALDGLAETYVVLASMLRGQDTSDFALALVRLALQLRPDHATARLIASDILGAGKRPELALDLLAGIRADDPLHATVQMRRARMLQRLERSDEALSLLEEIARDYPSRPEPLGLTGDILRIKRRFAEAVVAYDRAIALAGPPHPGHWPLYYDRGIALERSHQWEKAEADFLQALRFAPDQPHVLNYLGYSWTEQGRNLQQAKEMIEKAVQQRPNDGAMVDSLGWVAMRMGNIPEAVRLLERAVELEPGDATINGHLGHAYWEAGRRLEAIYQWRRALNLKPEADEKERLENRLRPAEQQLGITP